MKILFKLPHNLDGREIQPGETVEIEDAGAQEFILNTGTGVPADEATEPADTKE